MLVGPTYTKLSAQNWEESVEGWCNLIKGQSCPLFWESTCCFASHAYLCVNILLSFYIIIIYHVFIYKYINILWLQFFGFIIFTIIL
jgi:hypothetical protein